MPDATTEEERTQAEIAHAKYQLTSEFLRLAKQVGHENASRFVAEELILTVF